VRRHHNPRPSFHSLAVDRLLFSPNASHRRTIRTSATDIEAGVNGGWANHQPIALPATGCDAGGDQRVTLANFSTFQRDLLPTTRYRKSPAHHCPRLSLDWCPTSLRDVLDMSLPVNTTSLRFQSFCNNNDTPIRQSTSIDTRSGRIPDDLNVMTSSNGLRPSSSDGKLQCCCGRPECAYLENNNTILGGIERDLETAARLGQVRAHHMNRRIGRKSCGVLLFAGDRAWVRYKLVKLRWYLRQARLKTPPS
jgi:hypothetical protein